MKNQNLITALELELKVFEREKSKLKAPDRSGIYIAVPLFEALLRNSLAQALKDEPTPEMIALEKALT